MPDNLSGLFLATSLFRNISEIYPNHNLYVFCHPEFAELIEANPYVYKGLLFGNQELNNSHFLEGFGTHSKTFDIVYAPHVQAKHIGNYHHNACDITEINYNY